MTAERFLNRNIALPMFYRPSMEGTLTNLLVMLEKTPPVAGITTVSQMVADRSDRDA